MKTQTTIYNNIPAITDYLNSLDGSETVAIHNQYCQSINDGDNEIYTNDEEFFEVFFSNKVMEAVRATSYGEYNFQHDYVKFNGYGNLITFDNPSDEVSLSEIAERILEHPQDFDLDLEESFEITDVFYEGTEDDAREEYDSYKEAEMEETENEILSFEDWAKDNLTVAE